MKNVIVCTWPDMKPHQFAIFGRHRKPHCVYCGEIENADTRGNRCWERE